MAFRLGYKLHLAVDASSDLPLACIIAPANENEKKHAPKRKPYKQRMGKLWFWWLIRNTQTESLEDAYTPWNEASNTHQTRGQPKLSFYA